MRGAAVSKGRGDRSEDQEGVKKKRFGVVGKNVEKVGTRAQPNFVVKNGRETQVSKKGRNIPTAATG